MRTTVTLNDELTEYVDENFASDDESNAQAVREAVQNSQRLEERVQELEAELASAREKIDELEAELDRVKNEKRLILEEREEHTELVKTQKRQQSLQEQKATASLVERARWWITGMPDSEDDS